MHCKVMYCNGMHLRMHVCMYVSLCVCMHVSMPVCVFAHVCLYVCMYVHLYIYIYICLYLFLCSSLYACSCACFVDAATRYVLPLLSFHLSHSIQSLLLAGLIIPNKLCFHKVVRL